jgi:hypothetical protein
MSRKIVQPQIKISIFSAAAQMLVFCNADGELTQ